MLIPRSHLSLLSVLACLLLCLSNASIAPASGEEPELKWWKGNLHTHSLWSDGDEFPEMIASWYAERDYNFLALTDHNVLSDGMRWMKLADIVKRSDDQILNRYIEKFGQSWVETRGEQDAADFAVRLKPLHEFRHLLEQKNQFIMIPAEEISDRAGEIFNAVSLVAERLESLGTTLQTATKKYNHTVTAMTGRQGLRSKVERFEEVSAKANRAFPDALSPLTTENDGHLLRDMHNAGASALVSTDPPPISAQEADQQN